MTPEQEEEYNGGIQRGIARGRTFKEQHNIRDFRVSLEDTKWGRNVKVAEREAAWMRVQVSLRLKNFGLLHSPCEDESFSKELRSSRVRLRKVDGLTLRRYPRLSDYITHGRRFHVVNMHTRWAREALKSQGKLDCLPCANEGCKPDPSGNWKTVPTRLSCASRAPDVLISDSGFLEPIVSVSNRCERCRTTFFDHHPTTCERLLQCGVTSLLQPLPFDPRWGFEHMFPSKAWTTTCTYDLRHRQGFKNVVEKMERAGSALCAEIEEEYYSAIKVFYEQLQAAAGDEVFSRLTCAQRLSRAELRGEYLYFRSQPNVAAERLPFSDPRHFGLKPMDSTVLSKGFLSYMEYNRELYEEICCSAGCEEVVQLDMCATTGAQLGKKWKLSACNCRKLPLGSIVLDTCKLKNNPIVRQWLLAIVTRPNFKGFLLVIDNVPHSKTTSNGDYLELDSGLITWFKDIWADAGKEVSPTLITTQQSTHTHTAIHTHQSHLSPRTKRHTRTHSAFCTVVGSCSR